MRRRTRYQRLTAVEREDIRRGLAQGEDMTGIAKRFDRQTSTITREVQRNQGKSGYRAFSAGRRAQERATARRGGQRRLGLEPRLQA